VREALSARLDGEPEPVSPELVDRHLESCAGCRSWRARADTLRRRMVVREAPAVPDLSEAILDRIPAPSGERWPARIALAVVAIAQSTLSTAQLLGVATGMGAMPDPVMVGHLAHESAAWNLAIGAGLLWAALRPRSAAGQLPMLTGFVLVLAVLSVDDLAGHAVTAGRLLTHGFVLLGLMLLFVVWRQHRDSGRPGTGDAIAPRPSSAERTAALELRGETPPRHGGWHRPASGRRAA
jgi:predicted anti-sigma-YlaC factor YlaD